MSQKDNESENTENYAENNNFKIYDNDEYENTEDYQEQEKDLMQFKYKNNSNSSKNLNTSAFHVDLQITIMKLKSELQC